MPEETVASGRWARIHLLVLEPADRAPDCPPETGSVPFESWINGWLVDEAALGARVRVRTPSGRVVEGELVELDPGYGHSFGSPPPALSSAGVAARARLFADEPERP